MISIIDRLLERWQVAALDRPDIRRELERRAYLEMRRRAELGLGESDGNNRGPHIAEITLGHEGANWCAAEITDCYVAAARDLGIRVPFPTDWARGSPRRGARALARACARVGAWLDEPHEGCVVVIRREGSWRGAAHAMLFVRWEVPGERAVVVEGNAGPLVRVAPRDLSRARPALGCPSMFASIAG